MQTDEYSALFDLEADFWWYDGMRAIMAAVVERHLDRFEDLSILDVGCGTGFSLGWLRDKFAKSEAFGVDAFAEAASYWGRQGVDTAVIGLASQLPFQEAQFDFVTCFDVIYQLRPEEARGAVDEITRVLQPGGWLLIREPAYEWLRGPHDEAVGAYERFTLARLLTLLNRDSLIPKWTSYANTVLFSLAASHRLISRWRRSAGSDVRPIPGWLNGALGTVLKAEARVLRKYRFPFGLSIIVMAQKRG